MSAPPDRPLDQYTLRVVLAELDRRPTTPSEEVVSDLLATANPRARVVVLPEPFTDRADVKHWHLPFGTIISTARGVVAFKGSRLDEMTNDEAADAGAALIAAAVAEFAGGAK